MGKSNILHGTHSLPRLLELMEKKQAMHLANADVQRISNQAAAVKTAERYAAECAGFADTLRAVISVLKTREKRGTFTPPTLEQVRQEMKAKNLPESEAQRFIGYFQSNGWMVGKNKMADWEAAVGTWALRYYEKHPEARPKDKEPSHDNPEGWMPFLVANRYRHEPYTTAPQFLKDEFKKWKEKR